MKKTVLELSDRRLTITVPYNTMFSEVPFEIIGKRVIFVICQNWGYQIVISVLSPFSACQCRLGYPSLLATKAVARRSAQTPYYWVGR
jgi:hypothetical protein